MASRIESDMMRASPEKPYTPSQIATQREAFSYTPKAVDIIRDSITSSPFAFKPRAI
mgnify:CR=1 FL=1|jgi:hypothetical protein